MIEVVQTETYDPEQGHRGNCVAAAIASVFEIHDVDRVAAAFGYKPPSTTEIFRWTKILYPFLKFNAQDYCTNYRIVEEDDEGGQWACDYPDKDRWEAPTDGYWLASIISPRIPALHSGSYRGQPGLHMVVMKGDQLAWDPHPEADPDQELHIVERSWWSGL